MGRQCVRPGCSEPGEVGYGFSPRTLLVWLTPIRSPEDEVEGVLCRRHADLTTVPRGWTLDDRRETALRLFRPPAPAPTPPTAPVPAANEPEVVVSEVDAADAPDAPDEAAVDHTGEQLRLDEMLPTEVEVEADDTDDPAERHDRHDDAVGEGPDALDATGALDLTGAMERPDPEIVAAASSELLARAFLGTTRRQPRRRMRP